LTVSSVLFESDARMRSAKPAQDLMTGGADSAELKVRMMTVKFIAASAFFLSGRQGFPAQTIQAGTSLVTTDLAPITAPSPIVIQGPTNASGKSRPRRQP